MKRFLPRVTRLSLRSAEAREGMRTVQVCVADFPSADVSLEMFELARFSLHDMVTCGAALRRMGAGASCFEDVATKTVDYFYENLRNSTTADHACVLVRCFRTMTFEQLSDDLRAAAIVHVPASEADRRMKCLVLMASSGVDPDWNDRHRSTGHRAIALPSVDMVQRFPMIAQLVRQLGVDVQAILQPEPSLFLELGVRAYNVFHVSDALGSPYVPDQRGFVIPYGVRSVLGLGGVLPDGELYPVIMFSRVYVTRLVADLFRPLALSLKIALLPFTPGPLFRDSGSANAAPAESESTSNIARMLQSVEIRRATFEQLLAVHEQAVDDQSRRLDHSLDELRVRADQLARSNAELDQFAHVVSPDLQEPLRMVASFTKLLGDRYNGRLDADADEYIRFAIDGAHRMQALLHDLLRYARVNADGDSFREVNLGAVCDAAITNLAEAVRESEAVVTRDDLPTVRGNEVRLIELLQNLIANAIKFRRELPCRVHIRAERRGDVWVFSVRDNGIGIAPQNQERIFIVFQRLHSRAAYPGTGIGLAICKKIVVQHNGQLWVESEPGMGSVFRFTLPAADGPSAACVGQPANREEVSNEDRRDSAGGG